MNFLRTSLRIRLLALILLPLIIISMLGLVWRTNVARMTAEEVFDRNLMMLAFAISRDVSLSEGDSLSETTLGLFRQASGGDVFYHVYGPDGSFVTGYSSPPVKAVAAGLNLNTPELFDGRHQGIPVRVVQLAEPSTVDGITGTSVVTAWQKMEQRQIFARDLARRTGLLAALFIAIVAMLVLLGIRLSLKPLAELESAIKKRSADDLRPIVREVPHETKGVVSRLNGLFGELSEAKSAKDRFISNAAHQLRNPIAGIHSMAQATANAETLTEAKDRAGELLHETRRTSRVTEQLLSLERLDGRSANLTRLNLSELVKEVGTRNATAILNKGLAFSVDTPADDVSIVGNDFLLTEALQNLLDNALFHGGNDCSYIGVRLEREGTDVRLSVENDGAVIPEAIGGVIFERFAQGPDSDGSGLGLAIVSEIARLNNGRVELKRSPNTVFTIIF